MGVEQRVEVGEATMPRLSLPDEGAQLGSTGFGAGLDARASARSLGAIVEMRACELPGAFWIVPRTQPEFRSMVEKRQWMAFEQCGMAPFDAQASWNGCFVPTGQGEKFGVSRRDFGTAASSRAMAPTTSPASAISSAR